MAVSDDLKKAHALKKAGRSEAARQAFLTILGRYPGNKQALDALMATVGRTTERHSLYRDYFKALASLTVGQVERALTEAHALISTTRDFPEAWNLLGTIQVRLHRFEDACGTYRTALEALPDHMGLRFNLGKALISAGDLKSGIAECKKVAEAMPEDPEVQRHLATAQHRVGDSQAARATVSAALAMHPTHVDLLELSTLVQRPESRETSDVKQMEKLLADPSSPPVARRKLAFALARVYEATGDLDPLMDVLKTGNALRKQELAYDIDRDKSQIARIRGHFQNSLPSLERVQDEPTPIFIVGMPRSGTTLVEQILASHPNVAAAGELAWWNRAGRAVLLDQKPSSGGPLDLEGLARLRQGYLSVLSEHGLGHSFITDKMPINFRWIGLIAATFPDAPILHLRRDARAVCWSIYKTYFAGSGMGFAFDAADLVAYHGMYRDLMDHWDEILPGRVTHMSYEALTENQEAETRRLLAACGLDWDDRVLRFHETNRAVSTASARQVRQQMYQGSSEAWRAYASHMPELFASLPDNCG